MMAAYIECERCDGLGEDSIFHPYTCARCYGSGILGIVLDLKPLTPKAKPTQLRRYFLDKENSHD